MKKEALSGIFLAVLLVCGLSFVNTTFFSIAKASTNVNSIIITSDTTWTKANSPYMLTGPVAVSRGVTLTIEPGVTVNLGKYCLQVNGTLRARGTNIDNIIFNSESPSSYDGQIIFNDESNDWNEQTGSGSIIDNAIITYSRLILINYSSPRISNSSINCEILCGVSSAVILNNTLTGNIRMGGSSALISDNIFHNVRIAINTVADKSVISNNFVIGGENGIICHGNDFYKKSIVYGNIVNGCVAGIDTFCSIVEHNLIIDNGQGIVDRGISVIQNNTVTNNTVGIYSSALSDSPSTIIYNNFMNSSEHNLYLGPQSRDDVNATYNWWGTTGSLAISQTIYDNKNDFNLGKVTFEPFLTEPNSQAMPNENAPISTTQAVSDNSTTLSPSPTPNTTPAPSENPPTTPDQSGKSDTDSQTGLNSTIVALVVAVLVIVGLLLVIVGLVVGKRRQKTIPHRP